MHYSNQSEIESLIFTFEQCALSRSQWTHSAHLTIAFWYLIHYPKLSATRRIREGIQRYNDALGILQTKDSGYHETITLFWVKRVDRFLTEWTDSHSILMQLNALLQEYDDPCLPFQYYSRDRLMSWESRTTWLEPDLNIIESLT
jgi:hypothetical protein